MKTIQQKIDAVDASLKRWHSRLTRATTEINKLRRKRERLLKQPVESKSSTIPHAVVSAKVVDVPEVAEKLGIPFETQPLDIPAMFDRSIPAVAEEMTKARKAAEADARRQMPLSGKAALAAIRSPRKKK